MSHMYKKQCISTQGTQEYEHCTFMRNAFDCMLQGCYRSLWPDHHLPASYAPVSGLLTITRTVGTYSNITHKFPLSVSAFRFIFPFPANSIHPQGKLSYRQLSLAYFISAQDILYYRLCMQNFVP